MNGFNKIGPVTEVLPSPSLNGHQEGGMSRTHVLIYETAVRHHAQAALGCGGWSNSRTRARAVSGEAKTKIRIPG